MGVFYLFEKRIQIVVDLLPGHVKRAGRPPGVIIPAAAPPRKPLSGHRKMPWPLSSQITMLSQVVTLSRVFGRPAGHQGGYRLSELVHTQNQYDSGNKSHHGLWQKFSSKIERASSSLMAWLARHMAHAGGCFQRVSEIFVLEPHGNVDQPTRAAPEHPSENCSLQRRPEGKSFQRRRRRHRHSDGQFKADQRRP